ncbi:MAG: iron dicitrate transport regulator FecR [Comamonadaceae bacterium]|nr:MAG: iron dicitrate transport regulator FecR [Comamonadaceae bacterium]
MSPAATQRAFGAAVAMACALLASAAHAEAASMKKTSARVAPAPVTAQVEFVEGGTTTRPIDVSPSSRRGKNTPEAAPSAPARVTAGAALTEGARIEVPSDGYLRLRLADGSVVRVLAGSDVELRRLRRKKGTDHYESIIDVRRGKVESEVAPQKPGRVFEIHAPGAVASVRGTHFDVSVDSDGRVGTAVTEGKVQLQPKPQSRRKAVRGTLVPAGQGVVLGSDGKLGERRALPAAPDLSTLPAQVEDASLLRLDFPAVPGAAGGYEVRVARDEALHEVVRNGVTKSGRIEFLALDDGAYTVGVRALDGEGLAGAESRRPLVVHARPVPPLYQSPQPGARVTGESGQLLCSQTASAEWVHLQVALQADFSQPSIDQPQLSACRFGIAGLPPGDYFWRVASVMRGTDGREQHGPFAAPQRFSVVATPTVGSIDVFDGNENPTLSWQTTPGQTFRAQLARDEVFTDVVREAELAQPSWTLGNLPRGNYFVRLQARDASGLAGPFSPARKLRIGGVVQTSTGDGMTSSDGQLVNRP